MNKNLEDAGNRLLNSDYKGAIELYYKELAENSDNVFVLNKIAQCYMMLNNYNKAALNYEKIIKLEPSNIQNYIELSNVYVQLNEVESAVEILRKALPVDPNNILVLENLLKLLVDNEKYNDAYDFMKNKLISIKPTSNNYLIFGQIALHLEDNDSAVLYFKKAVEINNENIDAKIEIAKLLLSKGEIDNAKKFVVDILILDSQNMQAHKLLGQIYIESEDFELACDEFNLVLKNIPNDADAAYNLAYACSMLNQFKLASDVLRNAIALNNDNDKLKLALAYNYFSLNDNKKAKNIASEILLIDKNNVAAYRLLADIALNGQKYNDALEYFNNILIIEPENVYALQKKGYILSVLGLETEALICFQKSIEYGENSIEAYTYIADLELKKERYSKALEYYNKILELDSNNYNALCSQAYINYKQEEYGLAVEQYLHILKVNPNEEKAYSILANIFYMNKEYDLALRYVKEAIKYNSNSAALNYLCAKILCELGLINTSLEHFAKAADLKPDNSLYLIEFADVLFLNQEFEKAITVIKRAMRFEPNNKELYSKLIMFYGELNNKTEQIRTLKKYLKSNSDDEFEKKLKELSEE